MSKILKYSLIAFVFVAIVNVFPSCKKAEYPNLIQGTWRRDIVEDMNSTELELWKFESGKLTITIGNLNRGSANYFIKNKIRRSYLTITDYQDINAYNADWLIRDLDNDKLIIINDKEGGILTKEFVKYSD